jgi:hypothetical protein
MFDGLLDPATCGEITPAEIVTAIRQYNRAQATSNARVLAFIAKLLQYREAAAAAEEKYWAHDTWAAVRDDIGAAMSLSPRRASGQIRLAEALAVRLPEVAGLLEHGLINPRVAATIVYRTEWVAPAAQAAVDAEIARRAGGFTTLSENELDLAIDAVIEELDPDAAKRFREAAKNCDVGFGKLDDATGTTSIYGRILATDADLSFRVLNAMADTVCRDDPRNRGQLRAAGFGAVFRGQDRLVCMCGNSECPATTIPSKVGSVIIHILAEQGTIGTALAEAAAYQQQHRPDPDNPPPTVDFDALVRESLLAMQDPDNAADEPDWAHARPQTPATDGEDDDVQEDHDGQEDDDGEPPSLGPCPDPGPDQPGPPGPPAPPEPDESEDPPSQRDWTSADTVNPATDDPDKAPAQNNPHAEIAVAPETPFKSVRPAVLLNGAVIPTPLLAELIRTGAQVRPLPLPGEEAEPRYAFSDKLRRFIRFRDMLCRFPGCNRRAEYADIDHTTPHAADGATHASNGKVLCRDHHLAKTFRGGLDGWRDEQSPEGEVIWTAPTGHSYLTEPSTRLVFPDWNPETAKLPPPKQQTRRSTDPGMTMPRRKEPDNRTANNVSTPSANTTPCNVRSMMNAVDHPRIDSAVHLLRPCGRMLTAGIHRAATS